MTTADLIVGAISRRLNVDSDIVEVIEGSEDIFDQAATTILSLLADGKLAYRDWVDVEGDKPTELLGVFLEALAGVPGNPADQLAKAAYRSVLSVDDDAVTFTIYDKDGQYQFAFTRSGVHSPTRSCGVVSSRTISGRTLFLIAQELAGMCPPQTERRAFALVRPD